MSNLKLLVLQSFKTLHRTRKKVFLGDEKALAAARHKINEEYKKNKHIIDVESIKAMVKYSAEVEAELKAQVIQAREVKPGVFEVRITDDILKLENLPYDDSAIPEEGVKKGGSCCQQKKK